MFGGWYLTRLIIYLPFSVFPGAMLIPRLLRFSSLTSFGLARCNLCFVPGLGAEVRARTSREAAPLQFLQISLRTPSPGKLLIRSELIYAASKTDVQVIFLLQRLRIINCKKLDGTADGAIYAAAVNTASMTPINPPCLLRHVQPDPTTCRHARQEGTWRPPRFLALHVSPCQGLAPQNPPPLSAFQESHED